MNKDEVFNYAKIAYEALDSKKGQNIEVLKIDRLTVLADYFVIAEGTSTTQIKTLADTVEAMLEQSDLPLLHREGYNDGNWVLLDYGTLIVHVFSKETREFYNLEKLWADAEKVTIEL